VNLRKNFVRLDAKCDECAIGDVEQVNKLMNKRAEAYLFIISLSSSKLAA